MNVPSILIVDDEPNNFDVIEAILPDRYELHYASSGQEAITLLDTFQPDAILLDVMMPGIDGIEVCRRIRAMPQWQAVPIIIVTALTGKEDMARCLAAGADDLISKPLNGVELRARVSSMLRIKQQYDSIKTLSQSQANTIDLLQNNLNELSRNLFSSLPHELNTPLNGISGVIGILIDEHGTMSSEETLEFLILAQQSAQRLEKLTQRFLTYAQLELTSTNLNTSRPNRLDLEKIPVRFLIEDATKAQAKSVNRMDDLVRDLEDVEVVVSSEDLKCIIDELLENAFKFSQPGTPVKVSSKRMNGEFHLFICDRGKGMTEEQVSKIGAFMQFERKHYEQQGLGLGLKIVQKMTEIYGGKFLISSVYHQETEVRITLPINPSVQP
jgi:two-component system, sensor histidine kinase and response regulator